MDDKQEIWPKIVYKIKRWANGLGLFEDKDGVDDRYRQFKAADDRAVRRRII